jgi:hypothetical protein
MRLFLVLVGLLNSVNNKMGKEDVEAKQMNTLKKPLLLF